MLAHNTIDKQNELENISSKYILVKMWLKRLQNVP